MKPLIRVPSKMKGIPSKRMLRNASAKSCWESGDIPASKPRAEQPVNRGSPHECGTLSAGTRWIGNQSKRRGGEVAKGDGETGRRGDDRGGNMDFELSVFLRDLCASA